MLNTKEAARYLRIRLNTFRSLIKNNGGHRGGLTIKVGDRAVVLADISRQRLEILQWLGRGPIALYEGQQPAVVPGPFWEPLEMLCPVMEAFRGELSCRRVDALKRAHESDEMLQWMREEN